jgi:hypothetical protein
VQDEATVEVEEVPVPVFEAAVNVLPARVAEEDVVVPVVAVVEKEVAQEVVEESEPVATKSSAAPIVMDSSKTDTTADILPIDSAGIDTTDSLETYTEAETKPAENLNSEVVAKVDVDAVPQKSDDLEFEALMTGFGVGADGADSDSDDGDVDLFKLLGDDSAKNAESAKMGDAEEEESGDDELLDVLKGVEDDSDE